MPEEKVLQSSLVSGRAKQFANMRYVALTSLDLMYLDWHTNELARISLESVWLDSRLIAVLLYKNRVVKHTDFNATTTRV